jgi:FkbH-like protein
MTRPRYMTYAQALKELKLLGPAARDSISGQSQHVIAIGGNCNVRFLEPGLKVAFASERLSVTIHECDYDAWLGECLHPSVKVEAWVIWLSALGYCRGGISRAVVDKDSMRQALQACVDRGERVIVIGPETIDLALDGFSPFAIWNRGVRNDVSKALPGDVLTIDPDQVVLGKGVDNWYAPSYWTLAKAALHPDAATALANRAANLLLRSRKMRIKAIVVDLDNTLWGGVVGEDGADSVSLDPSGEGMPYLRMQRLLKDFASQGIPLAVVSKNNPDDARAPFRIRDEMILKEDDFVAFHATWDSKHVWIRSVVDTLNIGLDTVCFIDDSQHERFEAATFLPSLIIPDLPVDPELRPAALVNSGLFLKPMMDEEDRKRVEFYKEEAQRRTHGEGFADRDAYLRSLGMTLQVHPVGRPNLQRVGALVQKTNQFNLSNRRHSAAFIKEISDNPSWYTYCYSVADRFGAAGIVGVIFAQLVGTAVIIDTWLMSCRVINRKVEHAMFSHLLGWMRARGARELKATYVASAKNSVIASLLSELGLVHTGTDQNGAHFVGMDVQEPPQCIVINDSEAATLEVADEQTKA